MFSNKSRAAKMVALALNTKTKDPGCTSNSKNMPSTSKETDVLLDFDSDNSLIDQDFVPSLFMSSSNSSINIQTTNFSKEIEHHHYDDNNIATSTNFPEKKFCRRSRNERKLKRNTGEEYVTLTGKVVQKRQIKSVNCRCKCNEKISEANRKSLFEEYWSLAEYNKQTAYMGGLITISPIKRVRKRPNIVDEKRKVRNNSNNYHLKVNGKLIKVCRQFFIKTYDITPSFTNNVVQKLLKSTSSVPVLDSRGLKINPKKHSEETIADVIKHICLFPSYESHYTRRTTNKKFLPKHLNIQKMYSLYCEENSKPVSRKTYSKQFHKLGLSFKIPQVDTCDKCDGLQVKIKTEAVSAMKEAYEKELKEHHYLADLAYKTKKADKERAKEDSTLRTFAFDLQQCLATPYLNSAKAFYKRQLWTFNLTTHNLGNGDVKCNMWHEGEGGRGANQIATTLYEELMNLPQEVEHVILYSDSCGGQNRNSHVSAMFLCVMQNKPSLNVIDHKFMISGHSHMECDVDHGLIEKQKKKTECPISHPYDWYQLVRTVGKTKKFIVNEMSHDRFYDFASLLKSELILRKKDSTGELFKWHDAKWFRYTKTPGEVSYKTTLDENVPFKTLSFIRRGKPAPVLTLKNLYSGTLPISPEKKKDLLDLLHLIRPEFHEFYKQLKVSKTVTDSLPDIEEFEE